MPQDPNDQQPLVQNRPRTYRDVTARVCGYVWESVRLVAVLVIAAAACGVAYIVVRTIIFGVVTVTQALGV